ncbi:hypothetical protein L3X38_015695 [Prunus dulcis]|uniref:Uncharacterized protein n=1 Tax=Prunus dulcis TaxID=3755 RepID=A0AAD4Z925_PRUDU|nr:hypothetical protein L3X38_015695 [Prunus dulcis]
MTGTTSSSSPSQLPPPAAADSPEFGEEAADVIQTSQPLISLLRPPFLSIQAWILNLSSCSSCLLDIQFTFSFVSVLDICLTNFGDARTVRARIADQADYGPLNPASLRLELTLCQRDLPRELTDIRN